MKSRFRNWSDIRAFLAVMREGSTLAASRKLGMAQPTVARRIEALEHELDLTLFLRDSRGFRPTEAARSLMPLAEALEEAACGFATHAQDLSQPRPIRVTAVSANFSPRVTQIFSEFTALHPGIAFEFLPGMESLDLMAGEADVALRLTRAEQDPSLIRRKIGVARFTIFGSPGYAAKYGLPSSPDDMRGHRFVSFQRVGITTTFNDWILRHASRDQIVTTFGEIELMQAAIRAGQGLGIMNLRMAEPDEVAGRVIRCFDPPPELSSEHLMLISPQAYRRPEVKLFTSYFAPRYAAIFK